MAEFNLDTIIKLLEHAQEQGINVSLVDDELSVRFQKGKTIDKLMLETLKLNKPNLVHYFKTYAAKNNGSTFQRIQKADRTGLTGLPVSYAQERLWFIDQLEGSVQYHIPSVLKLKGNLNVEALNFAIRQIVNRHEVLRTVIRESDGKALQFIQEQNHWQLNIVDGSSYTADDALLGNYIQQIINEPFDLSKDNMIRAHLVKMSEQFNILVVTLHHIAADGWSASIIVRELVELYNAFETGRPDNLAPLTIQYADYAAWQRQYLQGEELDKKLAYWKTQLSDISTLQLPIDFERPAIQSSRGAAINFTINKDLADQLQQLSQQEEVTLFMTMLAAFNVLLYRYTGQQDICVGTPIAGRDQRETESLIGFFINSLALRIDLDNNPTFTKLLQQVKSTTLEAYENKELPFEKVVDAIVTERNLSRSPIFQVMFALQNMPAVPALRLGEVELSMGEFENNTSKFDLAFFITESGNGLNGSVRYCTDLFKESTIQNMLGHFTRILESVVKMPLQNIATIPLLDKEEEHRLLVTFNNRQSDYPRDKSIMALFQEEVNAHPSATAIVFENEILTYRQLNEKANQLAHYLIAQGISKESLVVISIERSLHMMLGILGILKAGAAYVPIDAEYPAERIQWMLEDTAVKLIITSSAVKPALPVKENIQFLCIDEGWPEIEMQPATDLLIPIDANQLAYIIYTSGSTGKPKGVMITQQNVVSLVKGVDYVNFSAKDVLLSTGSSSFDATTFEYWGMLLNGGRLVLSTEEKLLDNILLKEVILQQGINKMWFTSSWFNQLVEADITLFAPLETILVGGEKLSEYHVEKLRQSFPEIVIINGYGPTENTTFSLTYAITETAITKALPIGKPLYNRSAYILDENNLLVPVGVSGEICLGGDGLAKGYLNQPALTKEKFVLNPYNTIPGSRMYCTGDIGRWLPDGNIEYLGRKDEQVKIRGYRIELGEIESALLQNDAVKQAVVIASEATPGIKRLVAYVVTEGVMDKEGLSAYLQAKIPAYMVPAIWIQLSQLPLTSNGKVDKRSLPAPEMSTLSSSEYVAPKNETETQLSTIWKELLQQERVGVHDNFFELGGDSILTIQVVSRARRLGLELQPKDLFIHQTISKLSAAIAERSGAVIVGEQGVLSGASGLLPIQQWWLEMDNGDYNHFNQSVLLGLDKSVSSIELQTAVEQLMAQHDALRFSYNRQDGGWKQEYGNYVVKIITEDLQSIPKEQLAAVITEKASAYQQSLDITNGKLVKVVYLQTPETVTYNRLLIVIHHLAVDGVSWRILVEDMELLLNAVQSGNKIELGPKSSSMRQWYQALESWGKRRLLLSQANYWRQPAKSYCPLPVDKVFDGSIHVKDIAQYTLRLGAEQTTRLLQEVPRVYHTEINDLLLAALAATISDWTGKEQVNIGLEGHGREDVGEGIDTSRTIGWFTSLYPLQLVMPANRSEADLVKSIKEQLRQVPDKGLGYGVLKYINREASLQGTEPWDIVFNYLGQLDNVVRESKLFTGAGESQGAVRSNEQPVAEKMAINSSVRGGELVLGWSYSSKHYNESTIQQLALAYITNLEKLIAHCVEQYQTSGVVFTPSDYGLAGEIGYAELDGFLTEMVNGTQRKNDLEGLYRLSGLQEGMLFHGLYDVKIGAYMEQFGCELFGVEVETLKKSWAHMIRRHSILRSAFYVDALSVPVQCVYKNVELPVIVMDYRGMTDEEQSAAIKEFDEADKNQGFDFKAAPLMRLALFRLSDERYRMLWTSHHILFDGWSFPILMEEFLTTYELLDSGGTPAITEEDRYEDYIRYIEQTDKEQEEQYWRNYLQGVEQNTLLPFIDSTIERNKGKGKYEAIGIHIDAVKAAGIQQFAHRHRITLNTIMQGVWAYLLHRYTGNKNIVYGIIVSGRPDDLSGVEQRVGMYINTLPLHNVIREEKGVVEWLQILQAEQVNSRQFQHTPFPVVQGWSGVQGDLFDTLLTFENYPFSKVITKKKWALNVGNVDMQDHTNYPLSIVIGSSDLINIRFSYNAMLLDTVYVKEIRDHFENILLQIIDSGDKKIASLNLLTQGEQQQLLVAFNETTVANAHPSTVIQIFESQVTKTPAAIAAVFNEETITFGQLNSRANQLANYLRGKGVINETFVPICINRSLEMMIGILGILKAGGAYVPIDPDYPQERIRYMLEDTGASIVITNAANRALLSFNSSLDTIELDGHLEKINLQPAGNLAGKPTPDHLGYIIYTSGSTGKPKGVMIEHSSLLSYTLNTKTDYIGSTENKAGSFIHLSYTFDASITAIFMPLLRGKMVVIGSKQSLDIFEDVNLLKYAPYDFIKITPAHLELIQPKFNAYTKGLLTDKLVIGGEALHPGQFDSFTAAGINVEVINEYGPTEATVGCTTFSFYTIADKESIQHGICIGKPIDRAGIYILDEQNRPVPVGVKGEICIGGAGIARGYLNRPELTAERFVADPFSRNTGAKMYKTGDIGRWLPTGNIEYMGRADDQVKIRGYRIELGEVEQVLQSCEPISQGVVLAKADKEGSKRLVSYFVPLASAVKDKERELNFQRVASWKELYEVEYGQTENDENIDPEFNIIGWNDSFTGGAIPAGQMKEWLDDIVEVVLAENPGNVLEVGCGTGLIYYQLAGKVKKYIGCDLSRSSINQIQQHISKGLRDYGETELFTAPAHEVAVQEGQQVDTILLNSMVQYFPGEDYMNLVLEKCMNIINGQGRIIIGDVRDNRLLDLFKARLRMQKLQDSVSVKEFNWGLEQDIIKEEELCFDPAFFYNLAKKYPQITHVDIQWKQGDYINELSLYRFTAVIYVGIEKKAITPVWQSWNELTGRKNIVSGTNNQQAIIAISDVPNPRLWKEKLLHEALQNKSFKTVGEIMQVIETASQETTHIKQLIKIAAYNGYHQKQLLHENPFLLNLLFEYNPSDAFILAPATNFIHRANKDVTNIPLFTDISFLLQKVIREEMLNSLPDYMLPSEFTALRQLPLTSNGKVDRVFLSQREERVFVNTLNYLPPSTDHEKSIAQIWKELLHLERVGIEDNFFELGGHSLLAMRVIAAIRKELEVELNIKELFIHPTIGLLARHIQKLNKGLLLPAIEKVKDRPDLIPLSFSQERLWFIHQLDGSLEYHMPAVLRLKGALDKEAISNALKQIVERHEVLRTVIREHDGIGFQELNDSEGWQLSFLEGVQYKSDSVALKRFVKQLIDVPFDLSEDYMLRATLIDLGGDEYVLVATQHHIASDGWSNSIVVNDLAEFYNAYVENRTAKLKPLPVQYADFALWQRKHLQGDQWDKKLGYWKTKLEAVGTLEISGDFPRPPVQSTEGAVESFRLDKDLSEKLQALSQQQGATLFMTLLAAFNVLLYRYSGQTDICIGTPIAGRQQQEMEELVGFFVNTLALRSDLEGSPTFIQLLQQVKLTTLEAYDYQEVPFEKVVELVVKERDMSRSPLFQVMLILQNTPPIPSLRLGGVQLVPEGFSQTVSMFDLTMSLKETDQGLVGSLEYCSRVYSATTISRMIAHFQALLRAIIDMPDQQIGRLPLLSLAEKHQLCFDFNNVGKVNLESKNIIALFESQVGKTPDKIAIVVEDQKFTYHELNEHSNRLARHLRNKGVGTESLVPVCIERSFSLIVAIIGVLKAGGAYVPIDPDYPRERIMYMLSDTGSGIAIVDNQGKLQLGGSPGIELVALDSDWELIATQDGSNLLVVIEADHLAYVIYTSGSTGQPKGVMIEHASLSNYVSGFKQYFSISDQDNVIQQSSVSFDTMVEEIYPALISGACVYIVKEGGKDIANIKNYIENGHATILTTTPMVLDFLNRELSDVGNLRYCIVGGDVLHSSYIDNLFGKVPIVNGYGPSEATVCATYHRIEDAADASIIGIPVNNASVYIVNKDFQLVPIGVVGEICIGGPGVSRGYLNNLPLTDEKFVNNVFGLEPNKKIYKTGDIARWLPDGRVEYLGRVDEQVKIRGYRVELGEIERVLQQSGLVQRAAVLAKNDLSGNKRLVAYVIPDDAFVKEVIVEYLEKKLPQFMIPSIWITLTQFPLTNSGKVNKRLLPDPASTAFSTNQYVAPETDLEIKLVNIWQELLQVDKVGVKDNFFELGGHSLLAMRMVAYIERSLLVTIPIKVLFQFTCIADLSKYLEIQSNSAVEENSTTYKLLDV